MVSKCASFVQWPISLILISIIGFLGSGCGAGKPALKQFEQPFRIAFYNVENLFDTLDTPGKADEEFTPYSDKKWNTTRYQKKLADLERVIAAMKYPVLIGLSEVENKAVLQDLLGTGGLASRNYGIVHYESADGRGIDCALLYQRDVYKPVQSANIRIDFPDSIALDYTSRDIIYSEGILLGEKVHVFVNHWPSRRGGLAASEPKRTLVASHLRNKVDEIFTDNPSANIIIMGDLNDEPVNKSVQEVLGGNLSLEAPVPGQLYNCMGPFDQQEKGTYNYRGNWNLLDHIIVSGALLSASNTLQITNPTIFQESWMMYESDRFGLTPNRTYGGPNYYGGISDHLPVYVELSKK